MRMEGVKEHLERAKFLFELSKQEEEGPKRYRLMLAAVYSCRAITELMLEAADKQEVKNWKDEALRVNRNELEEKITPMVPYYDLIERIRIHDFHRFGILPPDPKFQIVTFGGPMKMIAQKGVATVSLMNHGPQVTATGNSQVRFQRPLLVQDGEFFNDESRKYVRLEDVLSAYLEKAPDVISWFKDLMT